jgi:hypothetical protein
MPMEADDKHLVPHDFRKPLHLNRDFVYRTVSRNGVEAMRDLLEQACREHWGYAVTSTIPWWINRGRYTLEELRAMTRALPKEEPVRHLDRSLRKMTGILQNEIGKRVRFNAFDDAVRFSATL